MNAAPFPARIREAREARMMSRDELAETAGTSRQLIYRYETGAVTPRAETLLRLGVALNVSPEFFFAEPPQPEPYAAFLRNFVSKTSNKEIVAVERQILWIRDAVRYIEEFVVLPPLDLPDFSAPSDPREIEVAQIEAAATALRRHWGFGDGVIANMVKLIESKGCIVVSGLVRSAGIDAFSVPTRSGRPLIVVDFHESQAPRRRIDIAHELGYLILHRNVDKRFLQMNPDTHRLIESQAFRFGSAFLMPEATFRNSVPHVTLDTLLLAKPQWRQSVSSMLYRAGDLRMIDAKTAKRLWINRNRRGWRGEEPFDDAITVERPQMLANALRTIRDSDDVSLQMLCHKLGLYPADLERYAGMDDGELSLGPISDFRMELKENRSAIHA